MVFGLGDVIIDLATATVLLVASQLAIPTRGIKYLKWQLLIAAFWSIGADYVYRIFEKGTLANGITFLICGTAEIITIFFVTWLGSKGCLWRNILVVEITIIISNMFGGMIVSAIKPLSDAYNANLVYFTEVDIAPAIVIYLIIVALSVGTAFLMRKIFRFDYRKKGSIFKWLVLIYTALAVASGIYRKVAVADEMVQGGSKEKLILISFGITFLVLTIVAFNVIAAAFNRAEKLRILAERDRLKKLIHDDTVSYVKMQSENEEIKKSNEKALLSLSQGAYSEEKARYIEELKKYVDEAGKDSSAPVTGDIYMDIMLEKHQKKLEASEVAFEYSVDSSVFDKVNSAELSSVLDGMLSVCYDLCNAAEEDKYIILSVRKLMDMAVVKAEFSKTKEVKFTNRLFNRLYKKVNREYMAMVVADTRDKQVVTDEGDVGTVSITVLSEG